MLMTGRESADHARELSMTHTEIIMLALYVSGFVTFGVTLAAVSWWTNRKEHQRDLRFVSKK